MIDYELTYLILRDCKYGVKGSYVSESVYRESSWWDKMLYFSRKPVVKSIVKSRPQPSWTTKITVRDSVNRPSKSYTPPSTTEDYVSPKRVEEDYIPTPSYYPTFDYSSNDYSDSSSSSSDSSSSDSGSFDGYGGGDFGGGGSGGDY